jgi:hypothetical protein
MKRIVFLNRLVLIAVCAMMSLLVVRAQDFRAWEFKTGHGGITTGKLDFASRSLTIEMWLNLEWGTIVKGQNISSTMDDGQRGFSISFVENPLKNKEIELRLFTKTDQEVAGDNNTRKNIIIFLPREEFENKWGHVAYVVSEADNRGYAYLNGQLYGDTIAPGGWTGNHPSKGFAIGTWYNDSKPIGKIADYRIWSVARTAQQIADNYNRHLDADDKTGLVLNYKFSAPERGQENAAGANNKGWCNPETNWSNFHGYEILSACPRNIAFAGNRLSWDVSDGAWEVALFNADDEPAGTFTTNQNSISLSGRDLDPGVTYYAKVRTLNKGFYSGWVASGTFYVENPSTDISLSANGKLTVYAANGVVIITADAAQALPVHSVDGRLVRTVNLSEGKNVVNGLAPGIYLINQQKIVI